MNKDTPTMHDASTRKPALHVGNLATATLGLALALTALPAVGQGAPSSSPSSASSGNRDVVPVVVVSGEAAAPAAPHDNAPLRMPPADSAHAPEAAEPSTPYFATVGDATRNLLDLQRSGQIASPVPRPVPGEIAQRSRARYLKSFEREIPEWFQSSVSSKPGQASGR